MKVLVTGGTGFIGRYVVDLLVQNRYEVRLFSRKPVLPAQLNIKGVSLFTGDLRDPDAVLEAMNGMDVFFHIGEIKNTTRSASKMNIRLVERIAKHVSESNLERLVFISSISVAGIPSNTPADEETEAAVTLRDQYTEYKRASERIIAEHCPKGQFVIIRPAFVYGPGSRYLGRMIEIVKRIGPIGLPFIGNGRNLFPFVQVQDIAAAIYLAGTKPDAAGMTFNITDGQAETWSDFLGAVAASLNRPLRIIPIPALFARLPAAFGDLLSGLFGVAADLSSYVSYFSRDVHFGNSRAASLLNWKPFYTDLAAGVREMVEWYSKERKR